MKPLPLIVTAGLAALLVCWLGLQRQSRSTMGQSRTSSLRVIRNETFVRGTKSRGAQNIRPSRHSEGDPATWVRDILQTADGDAEELARLADEIPLADVPAILAHISATETDSSHTALAALFLRKWARHEPAEAARWLAGVPAGTFPSSIFAEVITEWAAKDVRAMLTWVTELPEGESKGAALLSAGFEAAARKQPVAAVTIAAGLAPSPERDQLLSYSVLQWMNEDLPRAMFWIDRIPDRTLREELLAKLAVELSVQNEARAASQIATTLTPGATRDAVLSQILQSWARSAPKDAAEWVSESARGDLQPAAADELVAVWGERDWLAASEWVMRLPPGRAFDAAARSYALLLRSTHPNLAWDFAKSIGNDFERAAVMRELRGRRDSATQ